MATGDLTSLANVKAQRASVVSSDGVLASLITQASDFIATFCGRNFTAAASVSEIRDGNGTAELFLGQRPVASITSLLIDDTTTVPAQPAAGQPGYFVVDAAVLALNGYRYTRGRKNVRVTYTAGYSAVPKSIEQACIELVWSAYDRVPRGPDKTSESFPAGGMVVSWKPSDLPAYAALVIEQYRDVVPV